MGDPTSINADYKRKVKAAYKKHGKVLPSEVRHRLQEDLRLAWVAYTKGSKQLGRQDDDTGE